MTQAHRPHRTRRGSTLQLVTSASEATKDIPLPEGVILRSDEEMAIWKQFTRARACSDWREVDLLLMAKIVRAEADIRKHQAMLDVTGPFLKNPRGTPIQNPLFTVIDTLQRMQLALIRSMSLMQTATDPRVKNAAGVQQVGFANLLDGIDDLIARPE